MTNKDLKRIKQFAKISSAISLIDNNRLIKLIEKAKPHHSGIGGSSVIINLMGQNIFVKLIPVGELELISENTHSTRNYYELPLGYQYGIGSSGFGVWRELAAHKITTNWVISQQCPHFPMMYHWRLLKNRFNKQKVIENVGDEIEKNISYWENNSNIRRRLEDIANATNYLCIFLEYIPYNLEGHLIKVKNEMNYSALEIMQYQLDEALHWMRGNNFVHMDSHSMNVLTDGKIFFFTDFGLSISKDFDLSEHEKIFFEAHKFYDQCCTYTNILYRFVACDNQNLDMLINGIRGDVGIFSEKNKQFLGKLNSISFDSPDVQKMIDRYKNSAELMSDFYLKIQSDKNAKYDNEYLYKKNDII